MSDSNFSIGNAFCTKCGQVWNIHAGTHHCIKDYSVQYDETKTYMRIDPEIVRKIDRILELLEQK